MSDVSLAPIVAALTPIVVQVAVVVIAGGVSWAAARFAKATGVTVQQTALDRLTKVAQSEAGALIAAAGDNLAMTRVSISSPAVADIAARIVRTMPEVLIAAGITPANVSTLVAGEIGRLQATMTLAPAPLPPRPS